MKSRPNLLITCVALMAAAITPVLGDTPKSVAAPSDLERGKAIAFNRNKGNCLACHAIDGGELPGNSGPPLLQMALRFPDRAVLRAQIWDATVRNPNTVMPPYGKHKILNNDELDLVVDYLLSL